MPKGLTSVAKVTMPFILEEVPYLASLLSIWFSNRIVKSLSCKEPDHIGPATYNVKVSDCECSLAGFNLHEIPHHIHHIGVKPVVLRESCTEG